EPQNTQILSHGSEGVLHWSNSQLDNGNLQDYIVHLDIWGQAIVDGGDILLYKCNALKIIGLLWRT
ncbi:DUF4347 domain-containing protein, partial [Trichodesmium erythraeum 21-75]|nr:DUF4347 domain-containing protein [Trichodesmium erythraeum 21-75]